MDYTNRVVEFFHGGELRFGRVSEQVGYKIKLIDANGRHLTIPVKQVVVVHPAHADQATFRTRLTQLNEQLERLGREIDTELLWSSLDHENTFSISELASEYFGNAVPSQQSAVFRAVLGDRIHFKIKGLTIHPRTAGQVDLQRHALRKQQQRQALVEAVREWMRKNLQVGNAEPVEAPTEAAMALEELEQFLFSGTEGENVRLLRGLVDPRSVREAALGLLIRSGRLPLDTDPLLALAGIEARFPEKVLQQCRRLDPLWPDDPVKDLTNLEPFSIDSQETFEIDDCLSLQADQQRSQVGIHIANVASLVPSQGPVFEEALRRGSTIYLPHRTVTMFPPDLAKEQLSLVTGEYRPALSLLVNFDSSDELVDWEIAQSRVRVNQRLSYEEADSLLLSSRGHTGRALRRLATLAESLRNQRREQGALEIRRPELKIEISEDKIDLTILLTDSPSQRIVSEFMILANRLSALYCTQHRIPVFFRGQAEPEEPLQIPEAYDPLAFFRLFRQLPKSQLELEPRPHSSLGVKSYVQISSPIRRVLDLVAQQQITAHLAARELPHKQEDLTNIGSKAAGAEKTLKLVERQSARYYQLRYLQLSCSSQAMSAMVLTTLSNGYLVELRESMIRGRLSSSRRLQEGAVVDVCIDRLDPESDLLVLRLAET